MTSFSADTEVEPSQEQPSADQPHITLFLHRTWESQIGMKSHALRATIGFLPTARHSVLSTNNRSFTCLAWSTPWRVPQSTGASWLFLGWEEACLVGQPTETAAPEASSCRQEPLFLFHRRSSLHQSCAPERKTRDGRYTRKDTTCLDHSISWHSDAHTKKMHSLLANKMFAIVCTLMPEKQFMLQFRWISNVLTFGVNSGRNVYGDVMTSTPPGASKLLNRSKNACGVCKRQIRFAARTHPNCPKSNGKLQASPTLKSALLRSWNEADTNFSFQWRRDLPTTLPLCNKNLQSHEMIVLTNQPLKQTFGTSICKIEERTQVATRRSYQVRVDLSEEFVTKFSFSRHGVLHSALSLHSIASVHEFVAVVNSDDIIERLGKLKRWPAHGAPHIERSTGKVWLGTENSAVVWCTF